MSDAPPTEANDRMEEVHGPLERTSGLLVLAIICAGLGLLDFIVHHHPKLDMERLPAAYGLFGFAAMLAGALLAGVLYPVVVRREDHYERD